MDELLNKTLGVKLNEGFTDPFPGTSGKEKFSTDTQLANAIRLDIAAELDAINLYQIHAEATDDVKVKKVLNDIADEERVHVGELEKLLAYLQPNEPTLNDEGKKEAEDVIQQIAKDKQPTPPAERENEVSNGTTA